MKKILLGVLASACFTLPVHAHTPLCSCYDLGDNIILCEGGFSDGSSASGVEVIVSDSKGNTLIKSKMNEDGEIEFDKPSEAYHVLFNAGPGHEIEIDGEDIVE